MIINKFGRIVVRIGETFEYEGNVYRCESYKRLGPLDPSCSHCSLTPLGGACRVLECHQNGRIDEQYVFFVKVEGGEE